MNNSTTDILLEEFFNDLNITDIKTRERYKKKIRAEKDLFDVFKALDQIPAESFFKTKPKTAPKKQEISLGDFKKIVATTEIPLESLIFVLHEAYLNRMLEDGTFEHSEEDFGRIYDSSRNSAREEFISLFNQNRVKLSSDEEAYDRTILFLINALDFGLIQRSKIYAQNIAKKEKILNEQFDQLLKEMSIEEILHIVKESKK